MYRGVIISKEGKRIPIEDIRIFKNEKALLDLPNYVKPTWMDFLKKSIKKFN